LIWAETEQVEPYANNNPGQLIFLAL